MKLELRQCFAKNLKRERESRGITQVDLADKLGINTRYVQQLEGKNVPNVRLDTLEQIAKVLKIKAHELLMEH